MFCVCEYVLMYECIKAYFGTHKKGHEVVKGALKSLYFNTVTLLFILIIIILTVDPPQTLNDST